MKNTKIDFEFLDVDVPINGLKIDGKPLLDVIDSFGAVEIMSELRKSFMHEYMKMAKLIRDMDEMDKEELNYRMNDIIAQMAPSALMIATLHHRIIKTIEDLEKLQPSIFEA